MFPETTKFLRIYCHAKHHCDDDEL